MHITVLCTYKSLLLLLGKLLVLDGIKGDRVVLFQVNGELLKVPVLDVLLISIYTAYNKRDLR